jgi:hypothetical protein
MMKPLRNTLETTPQLFWDDRLCQVRFTTGIHTPARTRPTLAGVFYVVPGKIPNLSYLGEVCRIR